MNKKVNCIMLIDDNPDDNFFHERVIKKSDAANKVITKQTGMEALDHLKHKSDHPTDHPDLIFLDINMPGMNGWEFLEEFVKLEDSLKCRAIVVMLTSSDNPEDKSRAKDFDPSFGFRTKPLTKEMLAEVLEKYC